MTQRSVEATGAYCSSRRWEPMSVPGRCVLCAPEVSVTERPRYNLAVWRGDRADECDGLENRWAFRGPEGSNPSPSAKSWIRERDPSRFPRRLSRERSAACCEGSSQRCDPGCVPPGPFWVQIPPPPPNRTGHDVVSYFYCSPM